MVAQSFLGAARWCAALNSSSTSLNVSEPACLSLYAPFKQHFGIDTRASSHDDYVSTFGWYKANSNASAIAKHISTQEAWLYENHVRFMRRPGVYIDLAANDPFVLSNTFFLDRCRGWRGVCVEPNPQHHRRIRSLRGCELVPNCISNTSEPVES